VRLYPVAGRPGGPRGITLGTAVTISGAAASPNQGYHSSITLAFLLTMFNVRLGWWLGNPGAAGEKTYDHDNPTSTVNLLAREMMGETNDTYAWIYLSDGGHFENLGLYEMVLRRCRYIVVSDGGCDPIVHVRGPRQRHSQDPDRPRHPDRVRIDADAPA
jgi:hypothetical protein